MEVFVVSAKGEGNTLLSSFDNALKNTGVYNYNLIQLSSVIPPNTTVRVVDKFITPDNEHGYKLYVVMAEARSNIEDEYIGGGIGWYQLSDGRGVFVEHHGSAKIEQDLKQSLTDLIRESIKDLCYFRNWEFSESKLYSKVSIAQVKNKPQCALVIAGYQSEGW